MSVRSIRLDHHRRGLVLIAIIGNVLPIAVATANRSFTHPAVFFVGAGVACVAPLLVTALPRRLGWPRRLASLGGLVGLTLMQADSGGVASTYALLMVMPMLWFGTQTTDRDILVMLLLLVLCAFVPMLVFGRPAYPPQWGSATLLVIVCAAVTTGTRVKTRATVELTDRLRDEAILDPLTGLLNRRGWEQLAPAGLARAQRAKDPVTLVAFDLDHFKELNDSYGHDHGDRVLQQTAHHMRSGLRAGDVIARIGGDEFLALLLDSDSTAAAAAVSRLLARASPGTCSAGIATADPDEPLSDLQRRADLALYAAKAAGGGRWKPAPDVLRPLSAETMVP